MPLQMCSSVQMRRHYIIPEGFSSVPLAYRLYERVRAVIYRNSKGREFMKRRMFDPSDTYPSTYLDTYLDTHPDTYPHSVPFVKSPALRNIPRHIPRNIPRNIPPKHTPIQTWFLNHVYTLKYYNHNHSYADSLKGTPWQAELLLCQRSGCMSQYQ